MREKLKKKIFAVSDIHGHLTELKRALDGAGFDPADPDHLLVVIGDIFDRGEENIATLDYLDGIKNKVLLRGNHENILLESLNSGYVGKLQNNNGTVTTLGEFFPSYYGNCFLRFDKPEDRAARRRLFDYIEGLSFLFVTDNYIFTHGWLPMDAEGIDPNFRYARYGKWDSILWQRWYNFYGKFKIPEGKTLVVGHSSAVYGCDFDNSRTDSDYTTFYGDRFIAIDGTVPRSGVINVLVVEDTLDAPEIFDVTTEPEGIDELLNGGKRVFLDLFTEDMRALRVGDLLEITDGERRLTRRVTSLHTYPTFAEIEDDFESYELGLGSDRAPGYLAGEMRKLYELDEVLEYGALAIVTAKA